MAQAVIKTSFASGEWAPKLRSRVDVQKYHSGAALLRNFFVDFSGGGASTRQGTKFINQCKSNGARLIPFQPSTSLSYVLEFGSGYIRFYSNGAPIVEAATTITGATQANPCVITDVAHGYSTGDWVLITSVVGMTQLNGNYYQITKLTANTFSLQDLNGNNINSTAYTAYSSGGSAQRVYTITSPYITSDLFPNQSTGNPGLKFVQNVTSLIITHPSYSPQILTINSATNWSLTAINLNSTIATPTGLVATTTASTGAGWNYAYVVTAVDKNGQESAATGPATLSNIGFIGSIVFTNTLTWTAVPGAQSYNIYKVLPQETTAIPSGAQFGFIGNVTGNSFSESFPGIAPDFSTTPPIVENPFIGGGVNSYVVTTFGSYTTVPSVTVAAPPSGQRATAIASLSIFAFSGAITHAGANADIAMLANVSPLNSVLTFPDNVTCLITGVTHISGFTWEVTSVSLINPGSLTGVGNPIPVDPVVPTGCTNPNFNSFGSGFAISLGSWGVTEVIPVLQGFGYNTAPAVTFSSGAAAATAVISGAGAGNPGVPGFIQERLTFAGQVKAIQSFNMSQPASFYNFNASNPSQDSDAISGQIISEDLNDIRWLIAVPSGLLMGTGKGAWLVNGGGGISTQVPITPQNVTAQPQAFNGSNDLKPLKINFDLLHVTNKGNYVRDLSYNLYAQIFTGSDISVLANHLFFGYFLLDWCFAEEPFKTAWLIRNDGTLLSLAYVKEQDLIGFAHHDTSGQFTSVCSVIETVASGTVDAVYVVVQRLVNGNLVSYVERMADRFFPYGAEDSWSVDCALQTVPNLSPTTTLTITGNASVIGNVVTLSDTAGTPFASNMATNNWIVRANGGIYEISSFVSSSQVTAVVTRVPSVINPYTGTPFSAIGYTIWTPISTVTGLTQLIGQSVVGVADGVSIGPFTVSASGSVALGLTATKVTLGLAYTPQLQTLPLDLGEPTVQGKRKKIVALTIRVADTLGLQAGKTFGTLTTVKDFQLGAIPSTSTGVAQVTDLVNQSNAPNTVDGRIIIDQQWETAGSYCIQQNLPYPATILGVMPEVVIGDS